MTRCSAAPSRKDNRKPGGDRQAVLLHEPAQHRGGQHLSAPTRKDQWAVAEVKALAAAKSDRMQDRDDAVHPSACHA